nr:TlpA family protein disulfide reductase [Lachnospiraceae bacterium]
SAIVTAVLMMFSYTYTTGAYAKHVEKMYSVDVFKNCDYQTLQGESFTSEDIAKSKLTLINVWKTDCGPCVSEMPDLERINNEYDDSEVRIVGLCIDVVPYGKEVDEEKKAEELRILSETEATFTQILADEELYNFVISVIPGTPTTFVIDSEGNYIKMTSGGKDYEGWKEYIEECRL